MLCLSCRRASPVGSIYCGGCGRTFGTRLCGSGHRNKAAPGLACCTTCGSMELTEATRALPLRWLGRLLAVLVAFALWRWALAHLAFLFCLLWHATLAALALLLGVTPSGIVRWLDRALAWLMLSWLLGWTLALLPGRAGTAGPWLRGLPLRVLALALGLGRPLLRAAGRGIWRAVFPRRGADGERGPAPD